LLVNTVLSDTGFSVHLTIAFQSKDE